MWWSLPFFLKSEGFVSLSVGKRASPAGSLVQGIKANKCVQDPKLVQCLHMAICLHSLLFLKLSLWTEFLTPGCKRTVYHVDLLVSNTVARLTTLNIPVIRVHH